MGRGARPTTTGASRDVAAVLAMALLVGPLADAPTAQVLPGVPQLVGQWAAPFEEGGAAVPRCVEGPDGRIECKPTAQGSAVLKDGRVFYWNGLEGQENAKAGFGLSLAPESRNSAARVLDLQSGSPRWTVPTPERGGGSSPNIEPGHKSEDDPLGMAGVPGRPGDGFVGSTWGRLGGTPHNPTSTPDDVQENDADLFCADVVQLEDGRLLIAGGTDWYNEPSLMERDRGDAEDIGIIEFEGLRNAWTFNPDTDSFVAVQPMKYGRWYPALVPLSDGKVLMASGTTKPMRATQLGQVRRTETFDPKTNTWTENYVGPASETSLPVIPRLDLMPNGKIFYNGLGHWPPGQAADEALMALQQFYDPKTKEWEIVGPAPLGGRGGASQVMLPLVPPYDRATLLGFGGTPGPPPGSVIATPFSTLTTVDKSGNVTDRVTDSLHHARWFPSGVLLPDGTVAALAGGDRNGVVSPGAERAVHVTELFDPRAEQWKEMAAQARDRTYHNLALLLPDMRVLLGGHSPLGTLFGPQGNSDLPGHANNDKDPSFEVWSPPYLFRGPRPTISRAPAGIRWGETFEIGTPQAEGIESVVLMRAPSPQHVVDSDQRSVVLEFTRNGRKTLEAVAPPDGVIAPPGFYYLVVLNRSPQGPIPSVARILRVGETSDPKEAVQPFPDDASAPRGGSATQVNEPTLRRTYGGRKQWSTSGSAG